VTCCVQGTIKGHEHSYQLDDHHTFVTGKPMLVCGNTAAMVGEDGVSWLAKNFQVRLVLLCCNMRI
jgi:arsenite methyltransferase